MMELQPAGGGRKKRRRGTTTTTTYAESFDGAPRQRVLQPVPLLCLFLMMMSAPPVVRAAEVEDGRSSLRRRKRLDEDHGGGLLMEALQQKLKERSSSSGRRGRLRVAATNNTTTTTSDDHEQTTSRRTRTRIVGGRPATKRAFKFFVWGKGCGGVMIWHDIVLTAAHCESAFKGEKVLVGPWKRNKAIAGAQWRKIMPGTRRKHPGYNYFTDMWDFMMFKIKAPTRAHLLKPVELNRSPTIPQPKQRLTTIGFGVKEHSSWKLATTLQQVGVNYVTHENCADKYKPGQIDRAAMMCAGTAEGGRDSCQGDSGGPIFDKANNTLMGIVSFGRGCGKKNFPGVYSRVSGSIEWIETNLCELAEHPPDWCDNRQPPPLPPPPATGHPDWVIVNLTHPETNVSFRLDVQYDQFPEEFHWFIQDLSTGAMLVEYPQDSFTEAHYQLSVEVPLVAGQSYVLGMRDKFGDGICCSFLTGHGSLDIYAVVYEDDGVTAHDVFVDGVWGTSGALWDYDFTVPIELKMNQDKGGDRGTNPNRRFEEEAKSLRKGLWKRAHLPRSGANLERPENRKRTGMGRGGGAGPKKASNNS